MRGHSFTQTLDMNQDKDPISGEYIPGSRSQQAWRSFNTRVVGVPVAGRMFGFGTMLAIAVSYDHNQSIGWAILHGLFSWAFVLYSALFY